MRARCRGEIRRIGRISIPSAADGAPSRFSEAANPTRGGQRFSAGATHSRARPAERGDGARIYEIVAVFVCIARVEIVLLQKDKCTFENNLI